MSTLGGHPCLRYQPHVTFRPQGQTPRVPVRSLIAGPGGPWVGTGRAFRDQPLDGTLIVLQAYGQAQPWVLLTDTPVVQTEPAAARLSVGLRVAAAHARPRL